MSTRTLRLVWLAREEMGPAAVPSNLSGNWISDRLPQVMGEEDRANPKLLIEEAKLVRGGAQPVRLKALAEVSSTQSPERSPRLLAEYA